MNSNKKSDLKLYDRSKKKFFFAKSLMQKANIVKMWLFTAKLTITMMHILNSHNYIQRHRFCAITIMSNIFQESIDDATFKVACCEQAILATGFRVQ